MGWVTLEDFSITYLSICVDQHLECAISADLCVFMVLAKRRFATVRVSLEDIYVIRISEMVLCAISKVVFISHFIFTIKHLKQENINSTEGNIHMLIRTYRSNELDS